MPTPGITYRFGDFTLLPGERRLVCHGQDLAVGPRAFDTLVALVERAGHLVTKDQLLATVWQHLVVEESNLQVQVSQLRKVIGAEKIATVPGMGYRFTARVESAPVAHEVQLRRLSVIVLPFVETGAKPEQEYFADAITDEVTTQLSKIRGSYVIGSPTAFAYRRESFDLPTVARELGVRYVLQGRIERSGDCVETNVRLSHAATGAVIWSDSIEVPRAGVSNIRREVVARLASALNLQLITAEARRVAAENAEHPGAIDLVMQAQILGGKAWSRDEYATSLALCERALVMQPDFGFALALRARMLVTLAGAWPGPDVETQIAQAERDIVQALRLHPLDARYHVTLSRVRHLQFRLDAAIAAVEHALELNPNDSDILAWRGALSLFTGEAEGAFDPIPRALALSPRDPHRWVWLLWIGWAHLLLGRYEQAIVWLERAIAVSPFWGTYLLLVAAYAHLGRIDEARALRRQLHQLAPPGSGFARNLRFSNDPVFLRQYREHIAAGLFQAGAADALERFDEWAARQKPGAL